MNSGARINRFFRSLLSTATVATAGGPGGGGVGGGGLHGRHLPEEYHQPNHPPANQIDADFAMAMRLQQEEQRLGRYHP